MIASNGLEVFNSGFVIREKVYQYKTDKKAIGRIAKKLTKKTIIITKVFEIEYGKEIIETGHLYYLANLGFTTRKIL